MDFLMVLRTVATIATIAAALLVAANWSPKLMVTGFYIFIVASVLWMLDGWLEGKASLVIQNVVLLLINIFGVFRWQPKALES